MSGRKKRREALGEKVEETARKKRGMARISAPVVAFTAFSMIAVVAEPKQQTSDAASKALPAPNSDGSNQQVTAKDICTLADLLASDPKDLASVDIAEMQLLCGQGLTEAKSDIPQSIHAIDQLAEEIKKQAPTPNGGYSKASALSLALKSRSVGDVPFSILYLSVGRRLGYPLKIAASANGLSIHWEVPSEKFSVNGIAPFLNSDVERTSVLAMKIPEETAYYILKPADELSILLAKRGDYLMTQGRNNDALVSYAYAHLLSPRCMDHLVSIRNATKSVTPLFGRTLARPAPDYSKRISDIDVLNAQAQQRNLLELDYAKELNALQRKQWDNPRDRTKALNTLQLNYQRLRTDAVNQQNEALVR